VVDPVRYSSLFTAKDKRLQLQQGLNILEKSAVVHSAVPENFNCAVVCKLRHFYIKGQVSHTYSKNFEHQHEIYRPRK